MCHHTNSTTNPWVEICVDANAVPAHLAHGDYVGPCGSSFTNNGVFNSGENSGPVKNIYPDQGKENAKPGLSVYPNPGNGNFTISMNLPDDVSGERSIQVINNNGRIIKQINATGQKKQVIAINEPGTYFVKLLTGRQVITKKLVVIR